MDASLEQKEENERDTKDENALAEEEGQDAYPASALDVAPLVAEGTSAL